MLDLNLELDSAPEGANINQAVESVTSNSDGGEESCAVTFHFEILKGVNAQEDQTEAPSGGGSSGRAEQPVKKSRRGPRSKSSQYRGVTFYRRTGRWESHIWDCGKQVYLGGFDTSHAAARAYDRAAVKFRGPDADINFTIGDYEDDIKQLANLSKEEVVQVLRHQSNGLSRVDARCQGVSLHNFGGLGAQMGMFLGKKACDKEAIRWNGKEATSKFEPHASQMLLGARNIADEKLDLNLRVSLPSGNGPKLNHVPDDIVSVRNSKMENHLDAVSCDPPFNFLKRGLDHLITQNDLPSPFFSFKERKLENGSLSLSPQTLSTRTWQVQDQPDGGSAKVDTTQPLFPNVASSGFPLSATVPHHPSQPFLNLTLPSLCFIHLSDNTPQQYHHHNSQPPP